MHYNHVLLEIATEEATEKLKTIGMNQHLSLIVKNEEAADDHQKMVPFKFG